MRAACVCVVACVQWKEAGDRKREDILWHKWFQVMLPSAANSRNAYSKSPPPAGGTLIIFFDAFVNEVEIKMSQSPSFLHNLFLLNSPSVHLLLV